MIVWLITKMICWQYGVEMDIAARCICIPLSFVESIFEVFGVLVFVKEKIENRKR